MKRLILFSLFAAHCVLFAGTVYRTADLQMDGVNAGIRSEFTDTLRNQDLYWRIDGIEPGEYVIVLETETGKSSGSEDFQSVLFLNGRRIEFDSAGAIRRRNGKEFAEMQSRKLPLKNGDLISLSRSNQKTGTMRLEKERLKFAPLKIVSYRNEKERFFTYTGSELTPEALNLVVRDKTGARTLTVNVKLFDYFRNLLLDDTQTVSGGFVWKKRYPYKVGKTDQYRAVVTVTNDRGDRDEKYFTTYAHRTDGIRKKMWMIQNWLVTDVKDDGTLKTRTIQPLPPPDARWRKRNLPATYNGSLGWFKHEFTVPESLRGERYLLHFDLIYYDAEIYLNGKKIAHHGAPFSSAEAPLDVDITGKFNPAAKNTLLIAVRGPYYRIFQEELTKKHPVMSNLRFPATHWSFGVGEVWLEALPAKRIGNVFIDTSFRKKTISVRAELPPGTSMKNTVLHRGKRLFSFVDRKEWKEPVLWEADSPELLQMETALYDSSGKLLDVKNTRFGFREFWTEGMDILWNGKKFRTPAISMANLWSYEQYMKNQEYLDYRVLAKKSGVNCIRWMQGPGSISEDFCDELGIVCARGLVMPDHATESILNNDEYWKNKRMAEREIVTRYYNSPSIFTWFVSNEFYAFSIDRNFERIAESIRHVRSLDSTRFIEANCDLDMRGMTQTISTHYPPDNHSFRDERFFYPDNVFWRPLNDTLKPGDKVPRGQARQVANQSMKSPITWGCKPIVINEYGWDFFYMPPHGYTTLFRDSGYASASMDVFAHMVYNKLSARGQRDAGVSIQTPWRHLHSNDIAFTVPPVDVFFIQKYHTFYAGREVAWDVDLFYDKSTPSSLRFYWTLSQDGRVLREGGKEYGSQAFFSARETIRLTISEPGRYVLEAGFRNGPSDKLELTVAARKPVVTPENLILASADLELRKEELLKRAASGETIIIDAREDYPAWLPGSPVLTSRENSVNFSFRPDHPVLKGVTEQDLSFWYPDHKTASGYFSKPALGNVRTIVECGGPKGLLYSALMEAPYGKGCFLYHRFLLDPEVNPVAVKLLENMANYRAPGFRKAGVVAPPESRVARYLKKYGVRAEKAAFGKLGQYDVLIVDGSAKYTPAELSELNSFRGGMLIQDPSEQFGIGSEPVYTDAWRGRAIRCGDFPEIAGLTNTDLFWRAGDPGEKRQLFYRSQFIAGELGKRQITGAEPMLYPVLLARKGNRIFCTLDWMTDNAHVLLQSQRVISVLLTNLGIAIDHRERPDIPKGISFVRMDLSSLLNRTADDETEFDGKGGWSDQGPKKDAREFIRRLPAGTHTLAGIPFRIEQPNFCMMLESRYARGGYRDPEIAVGRKINSLYLLHSSAYTSSQKNFSIYVNYADGSRYEIPMTGRTNMRDWAVVNPEEPFPFEIDTFTTVACTVPQATFGKASLWRTGWINPSPDKPVRSISFASGGRACPLIVALTLGVDKGKRELSIAEQKQFAALLKQGFEAQKKKDFRKAVESYEQALEMSEEDLSVFRSLGGCYEALGDYRNALRVYLRSLELNINQPDVQHLRDNAKAKLESGSEER